MTAKKKLGKIPVTQKKIERLDIRISGSGGQGIISTGVMLGKAIAIGDGRNVTQSQSYGPEARGGATCVDIIVSDGEIYFPECNNLDLLVAFTYESYEKYASKTKERGFIIADENAVDVLVGSAETIKVPFLKTASEKFKKILTANIIALGFMSTFARIVSRQSILDALKEQFFLSKHLDLNIKALEEGFEMGLRY